MMLDGARSLLVLGSHADDIEIGAGGTVLRMVGENPEIEVTWVVLSGDGERAAEAEESAEKFLVGVPQRRVVVHRFRDSYFPAYYAEIKSSLHELADEVDPDVILTHRLEDRHQDHRLIAELTWNVFRNHVILEYEIPKYEGDLGSPNVFVPLDRETAQHKIDTIVGTFRSQNLSADALWSVLRLRGFESKAPEGLAEGFTGRKIVL